MATPFSKAKTPRGLVLWELVIWLTFFAVGFFATQIKVSTHWRRELKALQEKRLPYTGRRP